jgi:cation transport ATPase
MPAPDFFEIAAGRGIQARISGHDLLIGNHEFMMDSGVHNPAGGKVEVMAASLA